MKNLLFCAFTIFASTLISEQAHALFEARLTYGLLASKPDLSALYAGASDVPSVAPTYGLGADMIVTPPLFPIGFGLRYENMGLTAKSGGLEFKANYSRTSLLLNYRIIDTLLFLGPIASYGLSHSGKIEVSETSYGGSEFEADKYSSYSIGLEAGVKLIGFHLGAEAGYQDFRWKGVTDSKGTVAGSQDINMSGTYVKVLLGFGI